MKKIFLLSILSFFFCGYFVSPTYSQNTEKSSIKQTNYPYAFEEEWIEVMFSNESKVRLRHGNLIDFTTQALQGVDQILNELTWHQWHRLTEVPESTIDNWEIDGERNTGQDIYNLNNIYRLQIPKCNDTWEIAARLEALPGIYLARPVPKPMELPLPGNYQSQQGYLNPATNNPSGVDALYAWTQTGGTGAGVTICDLEYSWNYSHADITKAAGSQINLNVADPFSNNNHGTAVIGELVADNNGWGTTGICYGSNLKTCGTYYGFPTPSWNVPGALAVAIASLSPGDIILIEQQWDYTGNAGYVPIEWWLNYSPSVQTNNAVYAAIVNAVANGIHVVEAGGNGAINTGAMTWYGNSGAIIVGAGGAYTGGTYPEGNLQKLSFSSYGPRFDLQGWGENVVTTGYSDLYSAQGVNYYYTSTFSGTSSASPIVTGALACAEGYYLANVSATPPTPATMRTWLVTYGTAQVTPPTGNIGPRPNIKACILNPPPVPASMDFGDAPDVPYPTLLASNGARHTNTGLRLGVIIDNEPDGQPNASATGDDMNPPTADDEDGVVFTSPLVPGMMASVQVAASAPGMLNAWIDFNQVNIWADAGEFIFQNVPLAAGVNILSFQVPATAVVGFTYARFRINSTGGLLFYGFAPDGEVEDYQVFIEESQQIDWGDAPDFPYPTLGLNNGANHMIDGVTFMGVMVDPEPDGQPEPMALGDDMDIFYPPPNDDEDGVVFNLPWIPNQMVSFSVTTSVQGFLNVWFDFNNNGSWVDPGEHVFVDIIFPAGVNTPSFLLPGNVTGQLFARFRFCTVPGLGFMGPAPNGEVEDYAVFIEQYNEYDWGDAPDSPYPTLGINNGANHRIDYMTYLGSMVDSEPDGQPDPLALGDDFDLLYPPPNDDEDGVIFMWPLAKGNPCKLKVTASVNNALFNGWIDFNGNGSWAEPNEHVFIDLNLQVGDNYLTFITPQKATPGPTYARFRFSHQPALSYTGLASDGEVEDYAVDLIEYGDMKWQQLPDTLLTGLHADHIVSLADDWICNGGVVTDIHWWGNYELDATGMEKRGFGINHFLLHIYSNSTCLPNTILRSYVIPFPSIAEINTGMTNIESSPIYKYDFLLPEPFLQMKDTTYWLSVQAMPNDPINPPAWRWQEANRWFFPIHCGAADNNGLGWQTIKWPFSVLPPIYKYSDFAFRITSWVLDTLYLNNIDVTNGQDLCYDANLVIIVAGGGTYFTVHNGGKATMIAGQKISYMPGTTVLPGGYMHGYITTTGQFCSSLKSVFSTSTVVNPEEQASDEMTVNGSFFKVYPNPTTGDFILELPGDEGSIDLSLEIYSMFGNEVVTEKLSGQTKYNLSLSEMQPGVYILHVISGSKVGTVKIIKR
ncbi:MAG: S8 family peptidase [Bacteroidales bacterium]|nr:S8 family peptidase [Bacteroidales bacterium]